MGCIEGLHIRTMSFNLPLLTDSNEEQSYQKLKGILQKRGYVRAVLSNKEEDCALFHPNDSIQVSISIERWNKEKLTLRFMDDDLSEKPEKSEFIQFCKARFKSIKTEYEK